METWVILLIVFGVLLLIGLGVGGYFLFYSNKTETKSFKNLTSATKKPDPKKGPVPLQPANWGPTKPILGQLGYKPPGCTVVAPGLFDCPPIKMEISSYRIPQYDPVAPTIPYQGQYYYFRKNLS